MPGRSSNVCSWSPQSWSCGARRNATPARRAAVRPTTVRRLLVERPPGSCPAADRPLTTGRADAAAPGCGRPPARRRGRSQTPPGAATARDRGGTCTTALRLGCGRRLATGERRRSAPGCARSSRELVAALGTARLQHGAAASSAHAVAKAVLAGTTTIVRLERALQRNPSSDSRSTTPRVGQTPSPSMRQWFRHGG